MAILIVKQSHWLIGSLRSYMIQYSKIDRGLIWISIDVFLYYLIEVYMCYIQKYVCIFWCISIYYFICLSFCAYITIKYTLNIHKLYYAYIFEQWVLLTMTRWTPVYIFEGGGRTLTNLNMIDRQLMSSGIVSRDAFFCHNRFRTSHTSESWSFQVSEGS